MENGENNGIYDYFDALNEPVLAAEDGRIFYVNSAGRRLFLSSQLGRGTDELFGEAISARGGPAEGALRLRDTDYLVHAADLGRVRVMTLRPAADVSGAARNAIGGFTAALRGQLGVAMMSLDVQNSLGPNDPGAAGHMAMLDKSLCSIKRMTENCERVFCRDTVRLDARPMDMCALVRDVVSCVDMLARSRGVLLEWSSQEAEIPIVADGRQLEILLMQLLSNSYKFTPAGGLIRVTLQRTARDVLIRVSDNGEGIRPERLAGIFSAYALEERLRDPRSGVGLGLSVVRSIAQLHNGTAIITSEYGRGTVVAVTLPRRDPDLTGCVHLEVNRNPVSEFLTQLADVLPAEVYEGKAAY